MDEIQVGLTEDLEGGPEIVSVQMRTFEFAALNAGELLWVDAWQYRKMVHRKHIYNGTYTIYLLKQPL